MKLHPPAPVPNDIRYKVDPRLVPPQKAARYLHLTLHQFQDALPSLIARGFPHPCPVIGHFDLAAINHWLDRQSGIGNQHSEAVADDVERTVFARIEQYGKSIRNRTQ